MTTIKGEKNHYEWASTLRFWAALRILVIFILGPSFLGGPTMGHWSTKYRKQGRQTADEKTWGRGCLPLRPPRAKKGKGERESKRAGYGLGHYIYGLTGISTTISRLLLYNDRKCRSENPPLRSRRSEVFQSNYNVHTYNLYWRTAWNWRRWNTYASATWSTVCVGEHYVGCVIPPLGSLFTFHLRGECEYYWAYTHALYSHSGGGMTHEPSFPALQACNT